MADFSLSEDLQAIREEVARFAAERLRPAAESAEKGGELVGLRQDFRELDLSVLDWPERLDGLGLGLFGRAVIQEELAWGDAGLAVALDDAGLAAQAILCLGSEAQQERWLRPFAQGEPRVFALALEETDIAWEKGALYTMAAEAGEQFFLSGSKKRVLGADRVTDLVVFARTGFSMGWSGIDAFVVNPDTAVIDATDSSQRLGLRAVRGADIRFDGAAVPAGARLACGEDKIGRIERFLSARRVSYGSLMLGVARAAVEYATGYAQERPAFGKMIGQFQSIAFKIADMATEVEATRWLLWKAAVEWDSGEAATLSSIQALHQAQDTARLCGVDSVQVLGGAGFMEDYPVERWMRDGAALGCLAGSQLVSYPLAADALLGSIQREDS